MRAADLDVRPATLDDAGFASDVQTAIDPDDPSDPKIERYRWKTAPPWPRERFVFELAGRPVGTAFHTHAPWEAMADRYGFLGAWLVPEAFTSMRLNAAYDLLEERSRADGTRTFTAWLRAMERDHVDVLLGRGYREDRRGKAWELDLWENRERLAALAIESRERMRREGIQLLTLADDKDPEVERKLYAMSAESWQDIPTTVPIVPPTFEVWRKGLANPGTHRDRVWIARVDGDVVGVSLLLYPPVRGHVWTAYTGTARRVRGRGVARALKLETIIQAMELGVPLVRTGNDAENAPILHLNEELGYRHFASGISFQKPATP